MNVLIWNGAIVLTPLEADRVLSTEGHARTLINLSALMLTSAHRDPVRGLASPERVRVYRDSDIGACKDMGLLFELYLSGEVRFHHGANVHSDPSRCAGCDADELHGLLVELWPVHAQLVRDEIEPSDELVIALHRLGREHDRVLAGHGQFPSFARSRPPEPEPGDECEPDDPLDTGGPGWLPPGDA